jgi:AraC-like DNA-binding protein
MTEAQARVDAYAACVHLDGFDEYDVWCDERHDSSCALAPGTIHINDMRHVWRTDIRKPFHVVNFYIPQSALDEIADEEETPRVDELRCPISLAHVDTVFKSLALALLPALAKPDQANRLFTDHAVRAVTAHLTRSYGSSGSRKPCARGGLTPWQERRAKELLRANLSGDISLPELASACRLSSSHFSQAFKQTVGCPPHQWLLDERVARAKQLILNTKQSLSEIALETGFADQSHFTRVFSQRMKASPAAWRRAQG